MTLISILSLLFTFQFHITSTNSAHEFHVSKTLLEYKPQQQSLQVTLNIFIDDLELALEERDAGKLFLCTQKEVKDSETHIFNYLQETFQLNLNSDKVEMDWVGKEPSDDLESVWVYLEVKNLMNLKSLEVQNNLLMELFEDQKNIVQIIGPDKKSGYFMFQKGNDSDSIEF